LRSRAWAIASASAAPAAGAITATRAQESVCAKLPMSQSMMSPKFRVWVMSRIESRADARDPTANPARSSVAIGTRPWTRARR
jgi:hypothetical protein